MRMRYAFLFLMAFVTASFAAGDAPRFPSSQITVEDWKTYLAEAKALPDAVIRESNQQITITDQRGDITIYAFTTPNNPAHPGVVVRKLVKAPDGSYVINRLGYFAGDVEHFKLWWNAFDALDEKVKEDMNRK